jgi:hypothetical protein
MPRGETKEPAPREHVQTRLLNLIRASMVLGNELRSPRPSCELARGRFLRFGYRKDHCREGTRGLPGRGAVITRQGKVLVFVNAHGCKCD